MAMPELHGWLEKTKKIKGRLVNWKKRYFKRNGSRLFYLKSENDTIDEALGFIDLKLVLTAHPTMEAGKPYAFQLNTQSRVWYLATQDEETMMYWITGLVTIIKTWGSDQQLAEPPAPTAPKAPGVSSRMKRALPVPKRKQTGDQLSPVRPSQSEDLGRSPQAEATGRPASDGKRSTTALPLPPRGPVPVLPADVIADVALRRGRGRGGQGVPPTSQTTDNIKTVSSRGYARPRSVSHEPAYSYLSAEAAPEAPQGLDDEELDIDSIPLSTVAEIGAPTPPPKAGPPSKPSRPPPTPGHSSGKEGKEEAAGDEGAAQAKGEREDGVPGEEEGEEKETTGTAAEDSDGGSAAPRSGRQRCPSDWTQSVVQKSSTSKDFLKRPEVEEEDSHRTKLVKEVLATEESYCNSVRMMVDLYLTPLRKLDKRILSKLSTIFSNVESILQLNEELLGELRERLEGWNDDTSLIGDVFARYAPMLKMYSTYGNNYEVAIKAYEQELTENQFFKEAVEECDQASGILLHHLLIVPIQRVPRYNMLLKDVLKRTAKLHPDYEHLSRAYASMQEVATHINEGVRKTERNRNFLELGGRMDISQLLAPHRELLKEAVRSCAEGGKKDRASFQLLLFSDLFVHVPKSRLKKPGILLRPEYNWPLGLLWVAGQEGGQLELLGPGAIRLSVAFESEEEAKEWRRAIEEATQRYLSSMGKSARAGEVRDGSFTFQNGSEYSGKWRNGHMHGTGSLAFLDNIYDGEFCKGVMHGQGKLTMPTVGVYQGQFEEGNMSGGGKLVYQNGDTYVGAFLDGMRHGMGIMQYAAGDSYDGLWEKGLPHGQGKMVYVTGRRYNGEWQRGMRHGKGSFEDGGGSQYDGGWAHDRRHGQGTLVEQNGTFYEGGFAMDLFDGQGTLVYRDGRRYQGDFKAGRRHGRGEYTSAVGAVTQYVGEWIADAFNGKGTIVWSSGNKYDGHFKDGAMHGSGVLTVMGVMIEGKWNAGTMEGKATVRVGDKVIYSGVATSYGISSPGLPQYPLPQLAPYLTAEL